MLPKLYHQWIDWVGDGTGLPDTILHIHAGMALLMIARLITRRSFGTFIPWTVVAAGEAFFIGAACPAAGLLQTSTAAT